ncbi:MAG TPA: hypothetical protein VNL16_01310 [Chloroflexota bacterium]|nr:hypothetical protein [Chloroflexota bacterium]
MDVQFHADARKELDALPGDEFKAMANAVEKLKLLGDQLAYPHSSNVQGAIVRESRPRAGRSPCRAFYRRVGPRIIVGAIGPEAQHDPRGFQRAVRVAEQRIDDVQKRG